MPRALALPPGGLRHSTDRRPGITRRRAGRGWSYRDPAGERLTDPATLDRIRALAVPPAWTEVWISPSPAGHLQATGRDDRGRKQYRYHPAYRRRRDDEKYSRLLRFAERLPRIRAAVERDLARPGLPREKVLAAVIRLLELTFIRVGNDEYARLYRSFGLTTLRNRHAKVEGSRIRFRFRGKAGREHDISLRDRRLAPVVRRCRDLPGQELFGYIDEAGEVRDVTSDDVNAYIREAAGTEATAKDFRTWAGTVLAFRALRAVAPAERPAEARRRVVEAVRETADQLGNTPAVARASYVHPAILDGYLDDGLRRALVRTAPAPSRATDEDEAAVLALLRREARRAAGREARRAARPRAGRSA